MSNITELEICKIDLGINFNGYPLEDFDNELLIDKISEHTMTRMYKNKHYELVVNVIEKQEIKESIEYDERLFIFIRPWILNKETTISIINTYNNIIVGLLNRVNEQGVSYKTLIKWDIVDGDCIFCEDSKLHSNNCLDLKELKIEYK
jgi:hypothetical protein